MTRSILRVFQRALLLLTFLAIPVALAATIERVAFAQGKAQAVADVAPIVEAHAHSAAPALAVVSVDDPTSTLLDLVTFARTGKGRLAVGALIVLIVWGLRGYVFSRVKWFQTKLGGYVTGFGTALLLYVGTGLAAGAELTLNLFSDALVAGFAASGKLELVRDLASKIPPAGKQLAMATAALLVVGASVGLLATGPGCKGPIVGPIASTIVDCGEQNTTAIEALAHELSPLLHGNAVDRQKAESEAISAGIAIGGCALSEIANLLLAPPPGTAALPPEQSISVRDTLEHVRSHFTGSGARVVWHHADGTPDGRDE